MSAALLLPLDGLPVVVPDDDAALGEPEQPLHLVSGGAEAELALQHVRHDHVARRVHVVAVPGRDRVPGGEAQLLGQPVHLYTVLYMYCTLYTALYSRYTSSSDTDRASVRSLLLASRIVGIWGMDGKCKVRIHRSTDGVMSHLGSVRGDHLAVQILLPPPDCLEGGAAGEVEHHEGRGGVSKEYLQVAGARLGEAAGTGSILASCCRTSPGPRCPTAAAAPPCPRCSL